MIDFSSLVLAPAMDVFAAPITVTPLSSQPQSPIYSARGVWTIKPVDIITENSGVLSDRVITLGIRLADFTVPPNVGDRIGTTAGGLPLLFDPTEYPPDSPLDFVIDDVTADGQGGVVLTLKRITP